jgi:hypothetical protein
MAVRRLGLLALAATSVGGLNVGRLSSVKLKPVNDGRASNVLEVEAGSLWKERGAVIFTVRRAG